MNTNKILIVLSLGLLTFVRAASAAVVYMRDGSQIQGTVVSATAQDVRLHTANGDMTIAASNIQRVDYSESTPVQARPAQTVESALPPARVRYQRAEQIEEEVPGRQMLSLGFGLTNPVSRVSFGSADGGTSDNGDVGLLLGLQYHYFVSPRLAAGLAIELQNRSRNSTQSLLPNSNTDVYGNSTLFLGTLRYSLTNRGLVRPYVLGGLGANRTTTVIDAQPNPGFGWSDTSTDETRTLVDDSHWGLAETARIGIDFMMGEPALFSLEFGWTGISNGSYGATRQGQDLGLENVSGNLNILSLAARWGWKF